MNHYKNYEFFYVNGCSHTKGGGFENASQKAWTWEPMSKYYKEHYNVEWTGPDEVNWATRLSEIIGIPCHNHAIQGGGLDRIIRKTYEFIESKWSDRDKFFIILETPDPSRIDLYYSPLKEYFILNSEYDGNKQQFKYATTNYFPVPDGIDELQDKFKFYFDNFYNLKEHFKANERNLLGLYSFCKRAGIAIKLMQGERGIGSNYYDKTDIISPSDNSLNLIDWCIQNNKQIKHETNFEIIDGHPGYFAHIEYAKILKEWLDINL